MQTENVPELKIHRLTKAQFERELAAGNLDEYAFYLTPDEEIDMSSYATTEQLNAKADLSHTHVVSDVTDLQTALDGKANSAHTHDERYYTESEVDTKLSSKSDTSHTHDDRYYTESEVDTLLASKAETSHIHDDRYTTSGDGATYTATVDGITELTVGVSFIMIPHTVSTSTTPKLNVNDLGEKYIRRRLSTSSSTTVAGYSTNWLGANKPMRVVYDGTYWIVDLVRPSASDIYGTVPISSGGTEATTAESARANLGAMADVPVTASDAGKFLRVSSDGVWIAEEVPDAESASF